MFGDKLKEFRISKGLNQVKMAAKIGVGKSQVSFHETGKVNSYVTYTEKINRVFGVNLPLCEKCKMCGKEFFGDARLVIRRGLCPNCLIEKQNKSTKKNADVKSLSEVVKDSRKSGISYGKYVAGEKVTSKADDGVTIVNAEPLVPGFLELGKTIKI